MIREATIEDVPRIVEMGRALFDESPMWGRLTFSPDRLTSFASMLIERGDGFVWMAEREGRGIGAMLGILDEHWASSDPVASELVLYVEPSARGGTTAMRLITQFVAWASASGAKLCQAGVSTGVCDARAIALYERCGFDRSGTILEVSFVHGA